MKIASTIARYLLGLIFLTFGLNGFLHFIPMPPPTGVAAQFFFGALFVSRFYVVIFLLQTVAAVLLLANRYVPFGPHDSGGRDCQHTVLSHFHGACGFAAGRSRYSLVVPYDLESAVRFYRDPSTLKSTGGQ